MAAINWEMPPGIKTNQIVKYTIQTPSLEKAREMLGDFFDRPTMVILIRIPCENGTVFVVLEDMEPIQSDIQAP